MSAIFGEDANNELFGINNGMMLWSNPDTEGHMSRSRQISHDYAPNIRQEPQYFVINTSKAVSAPLKTNLGPGKSSSGIRRRKLRNDLHLGGSSCQNPKARRSVNGLYFGLSGPLSMDMRQPDLEWLKYSWESPSRKAGISIPFLSRTSLLELRWKSANRNEADGLRKRQLAAMLKLSNC
jgi:hypothetical protein